MSAPNKQQQYMQQPQLMQHGQYLQQSQGIPQSSIGQQQQPVVSQIQFAQPTFQQQEFMSQPYGIQQPQMVQPPQRHHKRQNPRHSCCGSYPRILSNKMHTVNFKLGICMLVLGIATLAFGIAGFFVGRAVRYDHHLHYTIIYYNLGAYIAPNVWCAVIYIVNGALAVAAITNKTNDDLMNAFYAFSIMSLILSVAHFSISLGTIFSYGAALSVWFNIISIVLSIAAFSFALAFTIILGREIYCQKNNPNMTSIQYQGPGQVVLPQALMQSDMANYPPEYNLASQSQQIDQNPAGGKNMSELPSQKSNPQLSQYTNNPQIS